MLIQLGVRTKNLILIQLEEVKGHLRPTEIKERKLCRCNLKGAVWLQFMRGM